jgi:hypothetical protein
MRPRDILSRTELSSSLEPPATIEQEGTKRLHAKDLPNATTQPFKVWHPPRMKTGLRNHPIGRKVEIVPLPEKLPS